VTGDPEAVDVADADALYRLLEQEIVPAYYERDEQGVPRRFVAVIKEAIRTVAPHYSARRMVKEYVERMYAPALDGRVEVGRLDSVPATEETRWSGLFGGSQALRRPSSHWAGLVRQPRTRPRR
jgi:starch phosphorylase